MKDKLNITIRIADQAPIPLSIKPEEEEYIRKAEESVNHLWREWRTRFNTEPEQLMAMIVFQFAKLYILQREREKKAISALEALEKEMQSLMNTIEGKTSSPERKTSDAPSAFDHPSLL